MSRRETKKDELNEAGNKRRRECVAVRKEEGRKEKRKDG